MGWKKDLLMVDVWWYGYFLVKVHMLDDGLDDDFRMLSDRLCIFSERWK